MRIEPVVSGPSLDGLDLWGALDALLYSLDSSVWLQAQAWEMAGSDDATTSERGVYGTNKAVTITDDAMACECIRVAYIYFPKPVYGDAPACERLKGRLSGYDWITRAM